MIRLNYLFSSEPILEPGISIKLDKIIKFKDGLWWEIIIKNILNLDTSVVTFDSQNNLLEIIYHKNLISSDGVIVYYGDNRLGIGEEDNEIISINFKSKIWLL